MKNEVTEKTFCDSIHSAISGNLELAKLFIHLFKNQSGGKKCNQLKK